MCGRTYSTRFTSARNIRRANIDPAYQIGKGEQLNCRNAHLHQLRIARLNEYPCRVRPGQQHEQKCENGCENGCDEDPFEDARDKKRLERYIDDEINYILDCYDAAALLIADAELSIYEVADALQEYDERFGGEPEEE